MKAIYFITVIVVLTACSSQRKIESTFETVVTRPEQISTQLEFNLTPGKYHNHPSFAVWVEDLEGNYIETLYVTKYYATGIFARGETEQGKWKTEPGNVRRPATLPYWSHKRNIKAPDGLYAPSAETAVPDALTGATPKAGFTLKTGSKVSGEKMFRVLFEVNQPWDSNNFWTNDKYPDNFDYKTSLQPALVYSVSISANQVGKTLYLNPIGHSHPWGENGELITDLTTITTAREIFSKIAVNIQ